MTLKRSAIRVEHLFDLLARFLLLLKMVGGVSSKLKAGAAFGGLLVGYLPIRPLLPDWEIAIEIDPVSLATGNQSIGTSYRHSADRTFPIVIGIFTRELIGILDVLISRVYDAVPGFTAVGGDVVIDVGANVGAFTLLRVLQGARTSFCFEPNSRAYSRLLKNTRYLSGVNCIRKCVGSHNGTSYLLEDAKTVNSRVVTNAEQGIAEEGIALVSATTLDQAAEACCISAIDLLKIDVEGFEYEVLLGAKDVLKITKRVLVEYHDDSIERKVNLLLAEKGFQLVGRNDAIGYWQNAATMAQGGRPRLHAASAARS